METIDTDADIEYVVKALAAHTARDKIVQALIHRRGMSWRTAERFIAEVEQTHRKRIAGGQLPLLGIVGVISLLVGLGMIFLTFYSFQSGSRRVEILGGMFITGIGMVLGSFVGFWQMFRQMQD